MNTQTLESPGCGRLCEPPRQVVEQLDCKLGQLAMFSPVATEALQLASDPDSSIQEFCNIIQRDATLAMNALSIANSVMYSPTRPIKTLDDAVVRLGFRECKNLIMTSCASGLMQELPLEQQWVRDLLWQHSFTTAVACGQLNRVLGIGFHGEEFAAGLLHDLGRLLLAVVDREGFSQVDELSFDETAELLVREDQYFGTNHCRLGAWYAVTAGVPTAFVDTILHHHTPEAAPANQVLVCLVSAADHMANHLQRHGDPAGYEPTSNGAVSLLAELVSPAIESRFTEMSSLMLADIAEETARLAGIPH